MDFIKAYWESQGEAYKTSHTASWRDEFAIAMEIETISSYIKANDRVLDVGCANGFSTFRQLDLQPQAYFTGVDFADSMIEYAKQAKVKKGISDESCRFSVGSVLELPFERNTYDVVYTTRVLINLPTWQQQIQGIEECLRVAKPGGTVIFSEGFWEPLCVLNAIRLLLQLSALVEHDFNRYLKKERLEAWLKERKLEFSVKEFSSLYYLGTRVIRDLILDHIFQPGDYTDPINKLFYELERKHSARMTGVQQAYIVKK